MFSFFNLNHDFLVFSFLFLLLLFFCTVICLFYNTNIIITYLCCELLAVIVLCTFILTTPYWLMLKVQVYVLLILGLVAAEMALGLTLFLKFYRVTRTISWK